MTPRTIRRAAERKAAKLARKASLVAAAICPNSTTLPAAEVAAANTNLSATAFDFTDEEDDALALTNTAEKAFAAGASINRDPPEPPPAPPRKPISSARLAANRQNAQLSSGPRTTAGKAKVSLNAIKTGLTSQVIVLSAEQEPIYQQHMDRRLAKYSPVTEDEQMLVQAVTDNEWRLLQIAPLESAIYATGLREFADHFADEPDPATRAALVRGQTLLHYRRDLSNLALQERRIRNHLEKDVAKLEALQQSRLEKRKGQISYSLKLINELGDTFKPSDCGFDFSTAELQTFIEQTSTQFRLTQKRPDFDRFLIAHRAEQKGVKTA
jgi:hypothetical protein